MQHVAQEQEPANGPDGDEEIGLRLQRIEVVQFREKFQDGKNDHYEHAHRAGEPFQRPAFFFSQPVRRGGNHTVHNNRGNNRHIHDPADGSAPQQGNGQGHDHDQFHGPLRVSPLIQLRKTVRQNLVLGHVIEQAAQGQGIADEAGHDQGEQGGGQQVNAGVPQVMTRRVKSRQAF